MEEGLSPSLVSTAHERSSQGVQRLTWGRGKCGRRAMSADVWRYDGVV